MSFAVWTCALIPKYTTSKLAVKDILNIRYKRGIMGVSQLDKIAYFMKILSILLIKEEYIGVFIKNTHFKLLKTLFGLSVFFKLKIPPCELRFPRCCTLCSVSGYQRCPWVFYFWNQWHQKYLIVNTCLSLTSGFLKFWIIHKIAVNWT